MSGRKHFEDNRDGVAFRGLHTAQRLRRILRRERDLADRFGGGYSLVCFTADCRDTRLAALRPLAKALKKRLRFSDEVGWLDDERTQIGVVMHRTPGAAAAQVADEICRMLSPRVPPPLFEVSSYPSTLVTSRDLETDAAGPARGQNPCEVLP
jgi:hypothetical protein